MIKKTVSRPRSFIPPEPTIRSVVTRISVRKWKGCIYISSYGMNGLILQYLKSKSKQLPPELKKLSFRTFRAHNREILLGQMQEALETMIGKRGSKSAEMKILKQSA